MEKPPADVEDALLRQKTKTEKVEPENLRKLRKKFIKKKIKQTEP